MSGTHFNGKWPTWAVNSHALALRRDFSFIVIEKSDAYNEKDRQQELAQLAQQEVFSISGSTNDLTDTLDGAEKAFFDALYKQLEAVLNGTGDQHFSDTYLNYREIIITLIETYDYKLYTPLDQELSAVFDDAINSLASTPCGLYLMTSTIVIDYYMNTGQTGYFRFNAKPYGASPCGYVVVCSTVGSKLDTQTPEAYCVTPQHGGQGSTLLARYPSGSSYVWFSANAVEFYCNTSGSAVQQGTLVDRSIDPAGQIRVVTRL